MQFVLIEDNSNVFGHVCNNGDTQPETEPVAKQTLKLPSKKGGSSHPMLAPVTSCF